MKKGIIIGGVVLALVGGYLYYTREKPPISVGNVIVNPPVSENSDSVPEPAKKQGGILKVKVKPKPTVTDPHPEPIEATIYIPRDPRKDPPVATVDSGSVQFEWTPVKAPFFELDPTLHLGFDLDASLGASPMGAISFITLADRMRLGAGVDVFGAGFWGGWEVTTNLSLSVLWRGVKFKGNESVAVGVCYRF